ncbi:MAG: M15 family metallopeptidase, partial [Pseudomonadota bacterium]
LVPVSVPPQRPYRDGEKLAECALPYGERFPDNSLDMGTGYDCFDALSHPESPNVGPEEKKNRLLLRLIMEKNGFKGIAQEWWHFTLKNEPYANTYFDFDVE